MNSSVVRGFSFLTLLRGNAYRANILLWYGFPRRAWEPERIGTLIHSTSLTVQTPS